MRELVRSLADRMDGDIADFVYVQCTGPHVGAIYSLYEFELGKTLGNDEYHVERTFV